MPGRRQREPKPFPPRPETVSHQRSQPVTGSSGMGYHVLLPSPALLSGCCAYDKFFAQEEPSLSIRRTSPPTMSGTPVIVIHGSSLLSSDGGRDETDRCTGRARLETAAHFHQIETHASAFLAPASVRVKLPRDCSRIDLNSAAPTASPPVSLQRNCGVYRL